uniref:(California timema) hypothetical protein n=1 Tax=Timema californicum TaxID=61474 RepID=A0A7R9IV20_TIMCA|nr:unnamed protein product [Timema californicum]
MGRENTMNGDDLDGPHSTLSQSSKEGGSPTKDMSTEESPKKDKKKKKGLSVVVVVEEGGHCEVDGHISVKKKGRSESRLISVVHQQRRGRQASFFITSTVDTNTTDFWFKMLSKLLERYDSLDIYNADEIGLFQLPAILNVGIERRYLPWNKKFEGANDSTTVHGQRWLKGVY